MIRSSRRSSSIPGKWPRSSLSPLRITWVASAPRRVPRGLRQLCSAHGVILIFDEVITGFRHHLGGYQTICGVTPDLTTLGKKTIANGFPMAAVCGKSGIMDHFNTRPGGDTFYAAPSTAMPLGARRRLPLLMCWNARTCTNTCSGRGERVRAGLAEIHQRLGIPGHRRRVGVHLHNLFHGRSHRELHGSSGRNDAQRFTEYRRGLMERGIFQMPANLKRCHLSFAHTDADLDRLLEVSEDVLRKMASESVGRSPLLPGRQ